MSPEEVRSKLAEINKEQDKTYPYVIKYNKLKAMRVDLQNSCPHKNAFLHSSFTDSYEQRTYGTIICHDCLKEWEERIHMSKCAYPKWEGGLFKNETMHTFRQWSLLFT